MYPRLTDEQREAVHRAGGPVAIEDESTGKLYFLVDKEMLDKLRQEAVSEAIRKGIVDAEASRLLTLDKLDAQFLGRAHRGPSA